MHILLAADILDYYVDKEILHDVLRLHELHTEYSSLEHEGELAGEVRVL